MTAGLSRRWPILPTLFVLAACATMIALGVWQLQRGAEKDALLNVYATNLTRPATSLPDAGPVPPAAMFRRATANCLEVVNWRVVGGRSTDGRTGYRQLAECRTGAEGPGFVADMGMTEDTAFRPGWIGGPVTGIITEEPVEGGLWASLTGTRAVPRPMLVASEPAPGLSASAPPDPSSVPNSHLAYAGQWFLFALAAAVIYVLALRKRWRTAESEAPPA